MAVEQIIPVDAPQNEYVDMAQLLKFIQVLIDEINTAFTVIGDRLAAGGL